MTETTQNAEAVQDLAKPDGTCFGCGPANPDGLQLKSFLLKDEAALVATVSLNDTYGTSADIMCGGIAATLIDCHAVWTVYTFAHRSAGRPLDELQLTTDSRDAHTGAKYVTGELTVRYQQSTPLDRPIHLRSWIDGDIDRKTTVRCELGPEGEVTATGDVLILRAE